jgi:hypothetical protein
MFSNLQNVYFIYLFIFVLFGPLLLSNVIILFFILF